MNLETPETPTPGDSIPSTELTEQVVLHFKSQENAGFAFVGGAAAALVGALLWAAITVSTGYQIGYMAVAVGFIVGFSVRFFGAGISSYFSIIGAVFSLIGCALGNLLAQVALVANAESLPYLDVIALLNLDMIIGVFQESFSPMDVLFYGLALYEGYRFSIRPITDDMIIQFKQGQVVEAPYASLRMPVAVVLIVILFGVSYVVVSSSSKDLVNKYASGAKESEGKLEHGKPEGPWTYYYENGAVKIRGFFSEGKMDSAWTTFTEEGEKIAVTRYKNGLKNGVAETYYSNGKLKSHEMYVNDRQHGPFSSYYEDGRVESKGSYDRNYSDGVWESYYPNGNPKFKSVYANRLATGLWTAWYENGVKMSEVEYDSGAQKILNSWTPEGKPEVVNGTGTLHMMSDDNATVMESGTVANGKRIGRWKKFYSDGKPLEEGEYRGDTYYIITQWAPDGVKQIIDGNGQVNTDTRKGNVVNGLKSGIWQDLLDSVVLAEVNFENGKLHGHAKYFFPDGTQQVDGDFDHEQRVGVWSWFHENGELESNIEYEHDKKQGLQRFFDDDGNAIRWELYENDKLIESGDGAREQ